MWRDPTFGELVGNVVCFFAGYGVREFISDCCRNRSKCKDTERGAGFGRVPKEVL
jgi:hypothetical protein